MSAPSLWMRPARGDVENPGDRIRLFALAATAEFGKTIAEGLDQELSPHEERGFEDGEHKIRPLATVQNTDVYVVQSLHGGPVESANDKLCRLLFFIGALKDAGAARVTAVVPYLCYARKDRRTKANDPVTTRYVAALFEAVGTDVVITLEVHNPAAFENAFRCRTVALTTTPLFVDYASRLVGEKLCVVSPDTGGAKRAELFREQLQGMTGHAVGFGFAEKHRSAGIVSGDLFVGDVDGATALGDRRSDQYRKYVIANRPRRAAQRCAARDRDGNAWAVHGRLGRAVRRSGDRPHRGYRYGAGIPARYGR